VLLEQCRFRFQALLDLALVAVPIRGLSPPPLGAFAILAEAVDQVVPGVGRDSTDPPAEAGAERSPAGQRRVMSHLVQGQWLGHSVFNCLDLIEPLLGGGEAAA
jgi:hypothetical protein